MITNRQKVYDGIKQALLAGELVGGDVIVDRALAERFQVSRTPVREAIRQLSAEGYIDVVPNVGTRVASLPKTQVAASLKLLGRIEQAATEQMAEVARPEDVEALLAINSEYGRAVAAKDWALTLKLDRQFHDYILANSGSDYAEQFANVLFVHLVPEIRHYFENAQPGNSSAYDDHKRLVAVINQGKGKKAGKLMRKQWLKVCRALSHFEN